MINAVVTRVPRGQPMMRLNHSRTNIYGDQIPITTGSPASSTAQWYRRLWELDGRCAFSQCMTQLPDPDTLSDFSAIRGIFSVGTKDARVGNMNTRAFISTNRADAYGCLYNLLQSRQPNDLLVTLFRHFSVLFHKQKKGCKAARGKRDINMLLPDTKKLRDVVGGPSAA